MWVLLINPQDSQTSDWELRVLDSENEANDVVDYLGLNHQHFLLPISKLVEILRKIN